MQAIVDADAQRTTVEDWQRIHLCRENGFFRAYNRSCWLQHLLFPSMKMQHRVLPGCPDAIVYVGFPVSSLDRYTLKDVALDTKEDGSIDVLWPENAQLPENEPEKLESEFFKWKEAIPIKEPLRQKKQSAAKPEGKAQNFATKQADDGDVFENQFFPNHKQQKTRTERVSLSGIAQEVLAFSIESHSPIECMLFLQKIKEKYASLY